MRASLSSARLGWPGSDSELVIRHQPVQPLKVLLSNVIAIFDFFMAASGYDDIVTIHDVKLRIAPKSLAFTQDVGKITQHDE
jgi:hypothetical protein